MQPRPGADDARGSDPLRGRLLDDRYRIGSRIARGGMASVYEALDVRLDRTVAVKVMHAGLSDSDQDRDFAERFVREARAAARLSHPNVVAVFDQGDDDGTVYLVMELVTGHTLRDTIVKESPMPPARALALLEPVLSALAAAHRAGLVHRDVKPENVLISDDGRVKVADFGLAKAVSADTQHTATQGVLIGTVSYLAPELVVDGRADARADVYAAGVLLYELLTGVKPHEGESPIQVAYKHVHQDVPPPSERVPDLPPYVDALVARATSRDRSKRPADAAVMLHQVHRVSHALEEGLRDDPELTQDLSPLAVLREDDTHERTQERPDERTSDLDDIPRWEPLERREPTTMMPTFEPTPPPPVTPERVVRPAPTPKQPRPGKQPRQQRQPRQPRPRRRRRGLVLLVLALVLALGVGGGAFWYGWARYATTPTVLGQEQLDAVDRLEGAGLVVAYADPVYDSEVPAGSVVAADPGGGAQVLPGDTVTLTLSLGELRVPQLRKLTEDQAQDRLLDNQLEFGESSTRYSENIPEGVVITSDPALGTAVEPGTSVDLVVSSGRRPIRVGQWVGEPVADAIAALEERKLEGTTEREEYSDSVPAGHVISQTPARGTLFKGDTVSFVVSRGPDLVEVPDVYLFGVDAAEQAMRDAGFEVEFQDAPGGFGLGYVTRSDPEFGSQVARGSTITLFVV